MKAKSVVNWFSYNRGLVAGIILGVIMSVIAASCIPVTASPLDPQKIVDANGLQLEYKAWQLEQEITAEKFRIAAVDLQKQAENQEIIEKAIITVAQNPTNAWQLLADGVLLGAVFDNIRKRGVIAGLKRNKA